MEAVANTGAVFTSNAPGDMIESRGGGGGVLLFCHNWLGNGVYN